MVNFKKVVAILCSATMIVAAPITAFAAGDDIQAGTGNIIAYSATTVTVPTAIKVSFNPQKWDFYLDDTNKVSDTQIVSLNYGISSMATMDRKISVSFEASAAGSGDENKKAVEFVSTAEEVEAAERGELKLYLAVVGGADEITASRGASPVTFGISDAGVSNVTTDLLADVAMTAADGGEQAFVTGDSKTEASIAFKLGAGEYALKANAKPTFGTSQTDFKDMVQPKTLGDIVGFTFTGAMNEDADWTKADLTAIAITPKYEIEDANGDETDVTDGGYNQIVSGSAAPTEVTGTYNSANTRYEINLPENVTFDDVSLVKNMKVEGNAFAGTISKNAAGSQIRLAREDVKTAAGEAWTTKEEFTFTFTLSGVNYTATISKN